MVFIQTVGDHFASLMRPQPIDDYAISKWEAEEALKAVAANTSLELVVVRPPLVYGPGCKGNLLRLLRLVHSGIPLPLGAAQNQRSFIGLNNLVDLLICCIDHPAAAGWTFLASDGEDFAIPQLIRFMAEGMNRSSRLFAYTVAVAQAGGSLLGKRRDIDRLFYSLQVNSEDTRAQLNWIPPVPVEEGAGNGTMVCGVAGFYDMMIRLMDVIAASTGLLLGMPLFAMLWLVIWFNTRAPLFYQSGSGDINSLLFW